MCEISVILAKLTENTENSDTVTQNAVSPNTVFDTGIRHSLGNRKTAVLNR